ncbi:MAG: chemotaxis-specific protein-glutamate methyltransferase CheB [Phycisphaerales bacterium]|nr:chemotaxis-specific protein-glutamate methyltransferase CheB [Phycisphaerales bacterium]
MIRVLVCDDSAFMRKILRETLEQAGGIEVVGAARDGVKAVELAQQHQPDVITMDVEMPNLDGLGALEQIMKMKPTPRVLMVSSLTAEGSQAAMKAMALGAADVLGKDTGSLGDGPDLRRDLVARVRALGEHAAAKHAPRSAARPATAPHPAVQPSMAHRRQSCDIHTFKPQLIVIGSSTGGPSIVESICKAIPPGGGAPVVVAQHMPQLFTRSLAERIGQHCATTVHHAADGDALIAGHIYICPGGHNTHILNRSGAWTLRVDRNPADTVYWPSVDVLFTTAARVGVPTMGVVLTGMGDDGGKGALEVVNAGGVVAAQSAETCVVYGMPKAVVDHGAATAVMSPDELTRLVASAVRRSSVAA